LAVIVCILLFLFEHQFVLLWSNKFVKYCSCFVVDFEFSILTDLISGTVWTNLHCLQ
jgi:hypothetical protein